MAKSLKDGGRISDGGNIKKRQRERPKIVKDNKNYTFANGISTELLGLNNKTQKKFITASTGKEELTMAICNYLETLENITEIYDKGQLTREMIRIFQDTNNVSAGKELINLLGIETESKNVEINIINFGDIQDNSDNQIDGDDAEDSD